MLNAITAVVLVVWTANFAASLLVPEYDGTAINGIFTVFIGAVLALKGKSSKDDDDDEPDPKRSTATRSEE